MEDLSLHILDIVENSITAGATIIGVKINEDTKENLLLVEISDNGKGMDEILKRVDRNLERMGNRAERFDLEALKRNLASLRERISKETEETVTREMERLALLAEDISKRTRMNELEALAREMRNRQRRLVESINDLKEHFTREGLEAVMKVYRTFRRK